MSTNIEDKPIISLSNLMKYGIYIVFAIYTVSDYRNTLKQHTDSLQEIVNDNKETKKEATNTFSSIDKSMTELNIRLARIEEQLKQKRK